jgi:Zn-dependent protease
MEKLLATLMILPGAVIALTLHEFAHALVATLLGDPTPKEEGRLSLNPLKHIDPIGFLMILVFRFGWAKPVRYDPSKLRKPVEHSVLIAVAGPLMNLLAGFLLLVLAKLLLPFLSGPAGGVVATILVDAVWIDLALFVFNLVPLPPLDGSHIVLHAIPDRFFRAKLAYARFGSLFLLGLILLTSLLDLPIIPITRITQNLFDLLRGLLSI